MIPKILALTILALIALFILRSLVVRDRDQQSKIALEDLLIGEDGRISKVAFAFWGAFVATTWAFLYLTLRDKITDAIFIGYGGMWVIPLTAKYIFNQAAMPAIPGATVTTEVSASKTTVTNPPPPEDK